MILTNLREQTRPYHERLESRMDILNRTYSLGNYTALLKRLYGFYGPIEATLTQKSGWEGTLDYGSRRKLSRLAKDLIALGIPPQEREALPSCPETPRLDTPAQILGCLYVLEGATLGGQIISRHLRETHGLTPDNGAAFFSGYGSETGRMWKSFGALLTDHVDQGRVAPAEVIAGACDTFSRYEMWVCPADEDEASKGSL